MENHERERIEHIVTATVDQLRAVNSYHFRVPPTTRVGDGIAAKVGEYLRQRGTQSVLIVTDRQILDLKLMAPMLRSLERTGVSYRIFDGILPDPDDQQVERGIECLQEQNSDTLLCFGGGSVIDAGKAIAVFARNPEAVREQTTNASKLARRLELVAVPTTAGTGSEVTDIAVITNSRTGVKLPHQHEYFIPDMAVIDPTLTLGIPPAITAATGIDILTHAVESFIARGVCTLGQALSQNAIEQVALYLRRAVGDGGDLEARRKLSEASYMAGMSFANTGLGLCHAIAHQIGARYHLAHGSANAVVLPEVMRFNMLVSEERFAALARSFRLRIDHLDSRAVALKTIDAVRELIAEIGLPGSLKQIGADPADFPAMAKQALLDPTITTNPRTVRLEDVVEVLVRSYLTEV